MKSIFPLGIAGAATIAVLVLAPALHAQGPMAPHMGAPAMPYGPMPHMGMPPTGVPPMGMPHMGMPIAPGMHRHGGMNPFAALNLTQEQLGKLEDIAKEARAFSADVVKKIGEEFVKLRSLIANSAPDAKEIGAVYQNIFDFQRQAIEQAIANYNQQLAVLNPEQLEKWNTMREQMMARFFPPPQVKGDK